MQEFLDRSLNIYRDQNDQDGLAQSYNNMSVFFHKRDAKLAKNYLMQAIAISEKIQDRNGQATYLHNFGAVLKENGELDQSIDYFTRALEIRREIHDYAGMNETLYNLALTLDELGSGKLAVELLSEVVRLDEQFDFPTSIRDQNALINFSKKYRGDFNENP